MPGYHGTRSKVFVSYRRADKPLVEPVVERLSNAVSIGDLFYDRQSIQPGDVWRHSIDEAILEAAVMLVAIGDYWLGEGYSRLDAADDMVRREIELGLVQCELVIPVLLGSATDWYDANGRSKKRRPELPSTIAALWERQMAVVRPPSLDADVEKLCGRFVDTVVKSRMSRLESLSLAEVASSSETGERNLRDTAILAARRRPNDDAALRSAGICELRHRNYPAARELLGRALHIRDCPRNRYYFAIAGLGGRRPYDLHEQEIYRILDLLEPDGASIGSEVHYRALTAVVKLDYFGGHGRGLQGAEEDVAVVLSSPGDRTEVDEMLTLVPTADPSVRDMLTGRRSALPGRGRGRS